MTEQVSASKAKRDPRKQPPRAATPQPDAHLTSSQPDLEAPIQDAGQININLSQRQLMHLQRTLGNKAVGNLLRQQKGVLQREGEEDDIPVRGRERSTESVSGPAPLPPISSSIVPTPASAGSSASGGPVISEAPTPASGARPKPAPPSTPRPAPAPQPGPAPQMPPQPAPPGAASAAEGDHMATADELLAPVASLGTFAEATGNLLKKGQRHKFKIERYRTFLEADFVFVKANVPGLIEERNAIIAEEQLPEHTKEQAAKLIARRKKFEARSAKIGELTLGAVEGDAQKRLEDGYKAEAQAGLELPLIDTAYSKMVAMREEAIKGTKVGTFRGSGDSVGRIKFYKDKMTATDDPKKKLQYQAHIDKHQARLDAVAKARADLQKAQTLRGQAELSEGLMNLKRKQLKGYKIKIKKEFGRAVGLGEHYSGKAMTGVRSAVASTLTLGIVEYEQAKADGGYTSKRSKVTMLDSWKRDWATLKGVWKSKAYGKMTALHLIFQGLSSLILKPLRKIFAAASLIFAGLSLIPGVAAVTGPLAAFCTLVTLGIVAAKVAVDSLLATWSGLALALNKNARNSDLLRGQATGQAADMAGGMVAAAGFFAGPAIGNHMGGNYGYATDNLSKHGGSIMDYAPGGAGAMDLRSLAELQSAKIGVGLGVVAGEKVAGVLSDLEAVGEGQKALFMARQMAILSKGQTPAESYIEIRQAKLDTLSKNEDEIQGKINVTTDPAKRAKLEAKLLQNTESMKRVRAQIASAQSAGEVASGIGTRERAEATPSSAARSAPAPTPAPLPPASSGVVPTPAPVPASSGGSPAPILFGPPRPPMPIGPRPQVKPRPPSTPRPVPSGPIVFSPGTSSEASRPLTIPASSVSSGASGSPASESPVPTPAPTPAPAPAPLPPSSAPMPASGSGSGSPAMPGFMQGAAAKERMLRESSTEALVQKAKDQLGALVAPLTEMRSQGSEIASGAAAAASSVSSATPEQGRQEVDQENSAEAQSQLQSAQLEIVEMADIVAEGPGAIDEAQSPTPASAS